MKVKILLRFPGHDRFHEVGDVVDLNHSLALDLIGQGYVEMWNEPEELKYSPLSRSTKTGNGGIGMGVNDIYPPSLLNVQTVNDKNLWEKPLSIVSTEVREFERDKTRKILLQFENVSEKLGLNSTNAKALAKAWGDDYTKWMGKSLKLVRVRVLFKGQQTDSIGVVVV